MVQVPPKESDPVVRAIFGAYEADADEDRRAHLGASVIGSPCDRAIWYGWRWAARVKHEGRLLALFERGDREEDRLVRDLRRVGIDVQQHDEDTGEQLRVSWWGGHFGGSCDGIAKSGVPGRESRSMVLEFKTSGDKPFKELRRDGVRKSKPQHFAQMQVYMKGLGLDLALYIAVNKNTDAIHTEFVDYDEGEATKILERAERIAFSDEAPERISEDPSWYQCKWCDFRPICHMRMVEPLERNCRTCLSSSPERTGVWFCDKHQHQLDGDQQRKGCADHLFLPSLLPWVVEDASDDSRWVSYKDGRGEIIHDRGGRLET